MILKTPRIKFHTTHKPWRTTKSRNLVSLGEVKLFEDNLVSKSGLKAKHLRLLLNDFSIIVPILKSGRVVFEWNYRHPLKGWELELPAGLIESGENPLDGARRELQEETGYTACSWKKIGWVHTLPGITGQRAHVFLAKSLQRGKAHREVEEMMRVQVLRVAEAYRLLRAGAVVHAPTVVALALAEKYLQK
jgi:ADP-ribose pyrophosphatase